ncbi:phenylacetate-CoA ligase [Hydrogenispora ethanolica]|uniref:Phenylacetate-coenzyme A ligase n=1 Tax=Hydrogenispora ethanolica TaxID=1082276 RepID=A0A4R1RTW0_HYDET|nr:phenylacetate--CoA ligase [Hydrogenispora ethanolica]TCL69988.1 phenylacetate-CoA ligase [Hydrogenispora ethanolica]
MIWEPQFETMGREDLRRLQTERLQRVVARVYQHVPFYRAKFDEAGIKPDSIRRLEDIRRLPFTIKNDLRDNYPYGMFAVPMREIVRIHSSSGTTGIPTVVGYTKRDLETWSNIVGRFVTAAGVTSDDIVQISFGYGLFTGGFGLHYGMERVGATVIPVSSGNTERQIRIMKEFGTTVLVATPSYALHMAEVAKEMGFGPGSLRLRVGLFGSEPWSEGMRKEIERFWGIRATDNYGLSEVIGPGVSGECEYCCGMHIQEDHFIPEIIDPVTGEPKSPGEEGELVLTALTKEALPIIRYRTRDITALDYEKCRCGRTTVRMRKTLGRSDDMLIIRGVNVFPSQIESVLVGIEEVEPHYQLIVDRIDHLDHLEVQVEVPERIFTGNLRDLEDLTEKIKHRIFSLININVKVKLVEPKSIERSVGKAKRVIDRRCL